MPREVRVRGTMRSLTEEGADFLQRRVTEVSEAVARANRCEAEVTFPGVAYPPTVNDDDLWRFARGVVEEMLGEGAARDIPPVMGGEDFSFYVEEVPGCFIFLAVGDENSGAPYPVHHPRFTMNEEALSIGAALHAALAVRSLQELA